MMTDEISVCNLLPRLPHGKRETVWPDLVWAFLLHGSTQNRSIFLSRKSSSAKSRRLSSPGQLKILVIKWTGQWSTEQRPEPWRRMTRPRPRGWVGVYSNGARRPWYITVVIRQTMLCNAMRCSKQQAASGWCRDGGNKKRPQLEKQQQVRRGNRCWCEVPVQIRMRG